jgi:Cof subfamily protein (haloacid dehalogenase superfamily)
MNLPGFEKPPGAIAIDLDGTLLNSRTQLSERNRVAINKCLERGIPVIIATSRPARIFNRIFPPDLAAGCSLAVMNGAIVKGNPPLSGYFKEALSVEITRSIIDLASEFDPAIGITLELDGYEFGANWIDDLSTLWERNSASPDMLLSVEEAILRQPCKIALGGPGTDIFKLAERLIHHFGNHISVVPSLFDIPLLNITNPQASKPSALRKLLTPRGISLERVIGFGDDIPDVDMLKECGIAIAVANAVPEVKAIADYHTASNDDDGVAIVLEQMLTDT